MPASSLSLEALAPSTESHSADWGAHALTTLPRPEAPCPPALPDQPGVPLRRPGRVPRQHERMSVLVASISPFLLEAPGPPALPDQTGVPLRRPGRVGRS